MNTATTLDHNSMLGALERFRPAAGEYAGFLSNHGPMAADAMIRLGGADRVDQWARMYEVVLEPAPLATGVDLSGDRWQAQLGVAGTEGDWYAMFRQAIAATGWRSTFGHWWPRLLTGAAASAAHGLIRTAHAARNLADGLDGELAHDELAAGLALWASRYEVLPGSPMLNGDMDLRSAIDGLPRLDPSVRSSGPGIAGRLRSLPRLSGFESALDRWGPVATVAASLDELVDEGAAMLLARNDNPIAYCHAVTVPASARAVLALVPEHAHNATLATCWQLGAALISGFAGTPNSPNVAVGSRPLSPEELATAAVEHGDEHVLKLTEACIRHHSANANSTLLLAADALRQRLAPAW